jgi:hypothetical protein
LTESGTDCSLQMLDECLKTCSFVAGIVDHSVSRNLKKPESVTGMRCAFVMSHNGDNPDNVPRDQLEPRQVGPAMHTSYLL